jgi:hypothetical protein
MARSSNMVIPEVTQAEGLRVFQEQVDVFNAASGGAIVLDFDQSYLEANGGDYRKPVEFARPSSVDLHVDEADPATADSAASLVQAKGATVFQSRRSLLAYTRDEVTRGKFNAADYSVAIAKVQAEEKLKAIRDVLLGIGVNAIDSMDTPSANYHVSDVARGAIAGARVKFTFPQMNTLLGLMRDAREDITTFVMHSNVFSDLTADGIANYKIENVGGFMIVTGGALAMGRRILVVDSTNLISSQTSSYYTKYPVLGLGANALTATIIGEDPIDVDTTITNKVKSWTVRQDYDVEFGMSGMKFVVANAVNPTDAEMATAANWDEYLSDHRECKVVKGIYNATSDS